MGNKFFVMGGHSNVDAEVFDGVSRKFTLLNLKLPCEQQSYTCNRETVSISRKVFAFCFCYKNTQPKLHVYDVDEKKGFLKKLLNVFVLCSLSFKKFQSNE